MTLMRNRVSMAVNRSPENNGEISGKGGSYLNCGGMEFFKAIVFAADFVLPSVGGNNELGCPPDSQGRIPVEGWMDWARRRYVWLSQGGWLNCQVEHDQ